MKYFEVDFTISPFSSDACDLLAALAGEIGFETFEETTTGLKGYIQQTFFSEDALCKTVADFPFEGVSVAYNISESEDKDWNEQWEQEGFKPISVSNGRLIIHDGRHLPDNAESTDSIIIEIDARLAFGTGTHETTRMICTSLLELAESADDWHRMNVLDCGTGTGILSICALKLGAARAIGYDIDEWSVDNARHNAIINQIDDRFTSLLGDATILEKVEGVFDLIMANINRNILLADMPMFQKKMSPGARLILSGFYKTDVQLLTEKAASLGLRLIDKKQDNDWCCLILQ